MNYQYGILFNLRRYQKMSLADLHQRITGRRTLDSLTEDGVFCKVLLDMRDEKFIKISVMAKDDSLEYPTPLVTDMEHCYGFASKVNPETTYIEITEHFFHVQAVLGLSVSDGLVISSKRVPIWGEVNDNIRADIFVIMPFDDVFTPVYEDHISKVCKEKHLKCDRADDISQPNIIMNDIWSMIYNAKAIICDCTGRNPNVFYELGIAHSLGKNVFCITQNENDIPFDIQHIRYYEYTYTPRGMICFEKKLATFFSNIYSII